MRPGDIHFTPRVNTSLDLTLAIISATRFRLKQTIWKDITNAVTDRIQQEKIYNKLVEHCYEFSKYHTDDYRVYDPEEGRTVIRGSAEQIKECFGKLLNKQEVKMLIETAIVPSLAKADEQYELDCENENMEI